MNKSKQGKKNRESGQRFELKVRKDLESKGWIVARWSNNIVFEIDDHNLTGEICEKILPGSQIKEGKLIPAKSRFGLRTTGFPDFVCFKLIIDNLYEVIGIECKSLGYLDKEEKTKCKWLLDNKVFSKILIAKKGKKRGEIIYKDYKNEDI